MLDTTHNHLTLETGMIDEIPVLLCIPVSEKPVPLVFYITGFTGKQSDCLSIAYKLGQAGIACLSFDPLFHGNRSDTRLLEAAKPEFGGIYPEESGLDVFIMFIRVIEQSAIDVQSLIKSLAQDTRIDTKHLGIMGVSMGAWVTYLSFATTPELQAAIPMMGMPTFTKRWLDLLDECAWSNPEWEDALSSLQKKTEEHTQFIRNIDPAKQLLKSSPRPLLIMNGDFDTDMMKTFTLEWYRQARHSWGIDSEYLQWNIYPVAHTVTEQMEQDAVAWFAKHLRNSGV